jgi:hypothetical protein
MLTIALAAAALAFPGDDSWASFQRARLPAPTQTVEIGTLAADPDNRLHYWLRLRETLHGSEVRERWIDSRQCPQARAIVESMGSLPAAKVAVPGQDQDVNFPLHGGYGITVPARFEAGNGYGKLSIAAVPDTPLAHWVDDALTRLESCWTSSRPQRAAPGTPAR